MKRLTLDNVCLISRGMYPVILREIAVEETALVREMVRTMALERYTYKRVVDAFREFGLDYDASGLYAEASKCQRTLEDFARRRSELSALGQVVQELFDLEGNVSFYNDYTLERMQSVLEETTTDAKNVLVNWLGEVHVD